MQLARIDIDCTFEDGCRYLNRIGPIMSNERATRVGLLDELIDKVNYLHKEKHEPGLEAEREMGER